MQNYTIVNLKKWQNSHFFYLTESKGDATIAHQKREIICKQFDYLL